MKLLGVRLDDHDASFCLYDNGKVSYLKTERIYQVKHHAYNNTNQWTVDLKRAFNLEPGDLDQIAIVADLVSYGQPQTENFESKEYSLLEDTECPVYQVEHHLAHALSAPMFPKTTHQFVFDGAGELFLNGENVSGTVWSVFKDYTLTDNNISNFKQRRVTDSFGAEYENLARYMELTADHPEDLPGKLMSLQSHGEVCNEFLEYLTSKLTDVKTQLSISTHPSNWEDYFKTKQRPALSKYDFAATIHVFLEQCILGIIRKHAATEDTILLTGGCAQNICWNTTIKNEFPNTLVTPHSADEGLAIGAMEWLRIKHNQPEAEYENFPYWNLDEIPEEPTIETIKIAANALAAGKIVGWYQGRGEVGPRALGNRSILMNPSIENAKEILNSKVKNREPFRPFGATILKERQTEYFECDYDNPYMLYVGKIKKDNLPAITHIDGTCRFQTLGDENPAYRKLIEEFEKITGLPLILNTSLNLGGRPIAGTKWDGLQMLAKTDLDIFIFGNEVLFKDEVVD